MPELVLRAYLVILYQALIAIVKVEPLVINVKDILLYDRPIGILDMKSVIIGGNIITKNL